MTYIPAERDPDGESNADRNREQPTEAIHTTRSAHTNDRTDTISASSDPSVTRPMPSVKDGGRRYDLSPDPATAPIETAPWQDTAPTARQEPTPAPAPRDDVARTGATSRPGPYAAPGRGPGDGSGGYPAQTAGPGAYPATAQQAAPRVPSRDLTFGIFMGQLLRAVFLLAAAVGVAYYALRTVPGQWADELALQEGEKALATLPTSWAPWIDMLPVIVCVFWGVLTLIFALAARRWTPLLVGLVSGLGAVVTVQLLKREFLHKAQLGIQESAMNSLPSGHTAAAAVAAMIAVMVAPARGRTVVAFLGALTTTLAGVATVLNSWHRPMDAVVSILVVACWGILGALLLRCLIRPERWRANRALGSLILGILALAAAAAGMAAMQTVAIDGLALATGGAAILGVSLVCAHQTARALRPRHQAG